MPVATNNPRCGVCDSKLVKNGKTTAGRTRWRCKSCGSSSTQHREDISRKAQLRAFITWLLGSGSQASFGGTGRSFRAAVQWCWQIPVTPPAPTGEVHDQIMLDGTYFNGWCVLIAFTGTHVLDWQWCDQEKKIAWQALMKRIPAPRVAIVDGGTGLHAALREDWPETSVQRCFFHVFQATRRHLTFAPRLPAGRELMALTKALMRVQDLDQGRAWLSAYSQWEANWDEFLKHRTYARAGGERPSTIPPTRSWWFTHDRLRRARGLYRQLIRNQNLFVWLDPDLKPADGSKIHRTTSPLEGGPNKAIKELLRTHRGLPPEHARTAVDWLLNSLTETPVDPWTLARAEHWNPPRETTTQETELEEPETYGTAFSWEDGNGIQHGWGGRSHR
ncbi:IS1249 family transposase [Pseudarthrobacter sp. J1763]|uniref:IS1249 family transposase n=1 Tax=Pseudarthrobacter sp. J1763 TaxID=3420445 RepID=UPI003D2D47F2